MNYVEPPDNGLPTPYQPDWQKIAADTSENSHMEAAFYLLREMAHWTCLVAGLKPERPLDRNRAVVRGLIVRLMKLMRLTLRELKDQETFQQLSVFRDAIETVATLLYLLQDDGSGARFDQYIQNSLIAERHLWDNIQKNIEQRGGQVLPIEERMMRSIKRAAEAGGVTDVSQLPSRGAIGYPSTEARVRLLGPQVYEAYRGGSVETHGDWNDLFRNHLHYEDGTFTPNLNSMEVRPQVPLMLVILATKILIDNLAVIVDDQAIADFFEPALTDLNARASQLDDAHERFLHGQ
ncbi:DUF5677 domain-containing protein [Amycolatopsis sp. NPDC005003]